MDVDNIDDRAAPSRRAGASERLGEEERAHQVGAHGGSSQAARSTLPSGWGRSWRRCSQAVEAIAARQHRCGDLRGGAEAREVAAHGKRRNRRAGRTVRQRALRPRPRCGGSAGRGGRLRRATGVRSPRRRGAAPVTRISGAAVDSGSGGDVRIGFTRARTGRAAGQACRYNRGLALLSCERSCLHCFGLPPMRSPRAPACSNTSTPLARPMAGSRSRLHGACALRAGTGVLQRWRAKGSAAAISSPRRSLPAFSARRSPPRSAGDANSAPDRGRRRYRPARRRPAARARTPRLPARALRHPRALGRIARTPVRHPGRQGSSPGGARLSGWTRCRSPFSVAVVANGCST